MTEEKFRPSSAPHAASEVTESSILGRSHDDGGRDDDPGTTERVIRLLPTHTVGAVPRRPGRPRKVERRPTEIDLEYHQHMTRNKQQFIAEDLVVRALEGPSDCVDTLRRIKSEVAKEAAALLFQRIENEKLGRDTSQVSTRRIDALTKIASIELEIKKMGADTINLKSERFSRIFQYLIAAFREGCIATGMSPEQIDLLFNHLGTSLDGWEDRAADLIR